MKKLSIIIPCYNEQRTVSTALDMVLDAPLSIDKELVIVNDGSTDNSELEIKKWIDLHKSECEIKYFSKENGGKGSAVRMGIENSTGDIVIIQDADCEYDPCDYEKCIQPILNGETQVVYGSRERNIRNRTKSSWFFYLGGLSVSLLFNLLYGTSLSDEPTCYKTFDGDLIRSIKFKNNKFGWEPEVTAKLLRMGFNIVEVPISYYPRKVDEGKKIRLKDGFEALWLTFLYRFAIPSGKVAGEKNISVVKSEFSFRTALVGIFCLAYFLRLLLAIPYGNMGAENHLMRPDSLSYCYDAAGFDWGFRAPLPCMVYWLFKQIAPNALGEYSIFSILLSSLTIFPIAYLGKLLSKRNAGGIIAAFLWCFNVTSIGHAPLILSDTLFTFFVAWQVFCVVRAYETKRLIDFAYALCFGTLAALSRGVNLPWILAVAPILALFIVRPKWKCAFALIVNFILVMVLLFPFMKYNYDRYGVWSLEYNAYNASVHNCSAVIAHAEKRNSNDVLAELQNRMSKKSVRASIKYNKELFSSVIKKYPASFIITHLPQWQIMLPDVPTVSENTGFSTSGRGTLGILRKDGIIAAVRHYFADGGAWLLIALSPLLIFTALGYLGCLIFLVHAVINFKKRWMYIILWGALSFYYIFLPGPVVMPRYHLPALIFIFGAAAWAFCLFRRKRNGVSE